MRVLIACEYSGIVRDSFLARGHDAMSCDILPTESTGPHYQGSVLDLLGEKWDLVIAHPPCTYISNAGNRALYEDDSRLDMLYDGAIFFRRMFDFNSPRICVENPVQNQWAMDIHKQGKPTQYVQPYQHGHLYSKKTGLWLRGLPPLMPTLDCTPLIKRMKISQYGADYRFLNLPASNGIRAHARSKTFAGIAHAMAQQWG